MDEASVVIIGAGPVGLAMSLELARYGVASTVLERHPSTTTHPKARNLNTRTLEIARSWGAAHDELAATGLPSPWTRQITYTETLAGREMGSMRTVGFSGPGPEVSPDSPVLNAQDVFEPILLRAAIATGLVDVRFSHGVDTFHQDAAGVEVEVSNSSSGQAAYERRVFRCQYLVAADGASSAIRTQLGIELEGRRNLGHFVNVYFRADLAPFVAHRPSVMFWVADGPTRGVFQPLDANGRWLCQISYQPDVDPFERYDAARCTEWIHRAVGAPVDVDVLSIGTWAMNATVAERLRVDRIMLVGDAAHQLPPTGGFGVNTGIVGARNLAWKLAAVLHGDAHESLLDTYGDEHRPVARYNAERSLDNSRIVGRIARAAPEDQSAAVAQSEHYGNFIGMELGFRYESNAVIDDGTQSPAVDNPITQFVPCARPGHRAPHLQITLDGLDQPIFDAFGTGFTLLCGSRPGSWRSVNHRLVSVVCIGGGKPHDASTAHPLAFEALYGVSPDGCVLIRPDGHVALRCPIAVDDPSTVINETLHQILRRTESSRHGRSFAQERQHS
jgi:putative polyketide hydroxylase